MGLPGVRRPWPAVHLAAQLAAQLCGTSELRIIFRHLLPIFLSHIIASLTLSIPGLILSETSLSFIGLGLRPPTISWGVLMKEAQNLAVMADAPDFMLEAHRICLPGQVELMVEQVGAERLMFGSWAPLHAQRPSMDIVLGAEIDERSKAAILGGNARRVFRVGQEQGR